MRYTNIIHSLLNPITIGSFSELFETIRKINLGGKCWFRGQHDSSYLLVPSVIRDAVRIEDKYGRPVEPKKPDILTNYNDLYLIPDEIYIKEFKKFLQDKDLDKENNDIDYICLAQHYGVKTRLLDWTTDASVSLFFAMDGRKPGSVASLFILDPVACNRITYSINHVATSEEIGRSWDGVLPIAFYGPRNDKRMCRQSGNFTIQGSDFRPLDCLYPAKEFLNKIDIPDHVCKEIEEWLFSFGINRDSIYIGHDVKDDYALEAQKRTSDAFNETLDDLREKWLNAKEKGDETHFVYDYDIDDEDNLIIHTPGPTRIITKEQREKNVGTIYTE